MLEMIRSRGKAQASRKGVAEEAEERLLRELAQLEESIAEARRRGASYALSDVARNRRRLISLLREHNPRMADVIEGSPK